MKALFGLAMFALCAACASKHHTPPTAIYYPANASDTTAAGGTGSGAGGVGASPFAAMSGGAGGIGGVGGEFGGGGTGFGGSGPFPAMDAGVACTPCACSPCSTGCTDCGQGCVCASGSPPPWNLPFAAVGSLGWKDSAIPLCTGLSNLVALDVWSDTRGVFAVVSGAGALLESPSGDDDAGVADDAGAASADYVTTTRTQIWSNDGSGWQLRIDKPGLAGAFTLTGLPGSALLLASGIDPALTAYGYGSGCALAMASQGELTCFDIDPVQSVFGLDSRHAYALMGGTRLLDYEDGAWHSNPAILPYPAAALWADDSTRLAVGRAGTVLWLEQGAWSLQDAATLDNFSSVWGTQRDDAWAGTDDGGIYHYDGVAWTKIGRIGGVTCDVHPPVSGIWGAGGSVYFRSATALARWNGTTLETLGNWSCSATASPATLRITGLWGTASDQVFVSIIDTLHAVDRCGSAYVVYYDGTSFHRM